MQELKEFSKIKFKLNGKVYEGIVMPRTLYEDKDHLTIKLKNGYNIGIKKDKIEILEVEELDYASEAPVEKEIPSKEAKILILGTGGTISSKVDYRTGAVKPAFTAPQIIDMVPELVEIAGIKVKTIMNELSENMQPSQWSLMAEEAYNGFKEGYSGIIIAHGTDTMHYSAAALSFALENPPGPVVFVGSQRSSDRPSTDAALNLLGAAIFAARSGSPGVYVAMHASTSDDLIAIHKGVKVRKNHTSRRDAFQSVNAKPFAYVDVRKKEVIFNEKPSLKGGDLKLYKNFDDSAALIKFYPGIGKPILESVLNFDNFKAVIIEGTGLGHVSRKAFPYIKEYIESGGFVGMTSQCIWGSVRLTVYETGRDLLSMGVVPLGDMLSEVALVKAMWALGNKLDLKEVMPKNLRGEISERRELS